MDIVTYLGGKVLNTTNPAGSQNNLGRGGLGGQGNGGFGGGGVVSVLAASAAVVLAAENSAGAASMEAAVVAMEAEVGAAVSKQHTRVWISKSKPAVFRDDSST